MLYTHTLAQSKPNPFIGEPFPEYTFNNVRYFKQPFRSAKPETIEMKQFRGKWVILDFWTRSCDSCVKSFPKLNGLQADFEDKVQFLLIGSNDRYNKNIEPYFDGVRTAFGLRIPVAYDSVLIKRLKIFYVPQLVLVDPAGIIRKVISPSAISKSSLEKIISENSVD